MVKVLIIEDDKLMVDLEKKFLEKYFNDYNIIDYKIDSESNPIKALGLIKEDPDYDVILLDLMMPELNGLEVRRVIKKEFPHLVVRIVFVSSLSIYAAKKIEKEEGVYVDFILKPFEYDVFSEMIKKFI